MTASRIASLLVAVGLAGALLIWGGPAPRPGPAALMLAAALLPPLAMIWFPKAIGAWRPPTPSGFARRPTPPELVAGAGWFLLLGLPLLVWVIWWSGG